MMNYSIATLVLASVWQDIFMSKKVSNYRLKKYYLLFVYKSIIEIANR